MANLFDFESFINELRANDKKREVIELYESYYGPINPDLKKQVWYATYVKAFEDLYPEKNGVLVPVDLEKDFDWKVLFALITASFSSTFRFEKVENDPSGPLRLWIKVSSKKVDSGTIEKSLDELTSFQIIRLYEIYIEEQIDLQRIQAEELDSDGINEERRERLASLKKSLKRVSGEDDDEEDDDDEVIVYHYTSLKLFSEILQSRVLRATNVRFLQGRTEVKRWFDVFDKAVWEVKKRLLQSEDVDKALAFLEEIERQVSKAKNLETYIFSSSRCPDDERQFDLYGDGGKGVSIGFKRASLENRAFAINDILKVKRREVVEGLLHGYVEYDENKLVNDIKRQIDELLEDCKASHRSPNELLDSVSLSEHFAESCIRIYMRCQDAKDASYSSEKEYCFYWQQKKDNSLKAVDLAFEKGRILPYVNLEFGKERLPITEIIVGPRCDDSVLDDIRQVMEVMGYKDLTIRKSEIHSKKDTLEGKH